MCDVTKGVNRSTLDAKASATGIDFLAPSSAHEILVCAHSRCMPVEPIILSGVANSAAQRAPVILASSVG
jgi:hypothetical protein